MECFACNHVCPTGAVEIDKIESCMRLLEGRHPVRVIEEKCTGCNRCNETCPTTDISLSAESCSFCIICKNRPNCVIPYEDRISTLNSFSSLAGFLVLMPRFIFHKKHNV